MYRNNYLIHYIHNTNKRYCDSISEEDVYSMYQHKLSLPHVSKGYIYTKNIERGKLFVEGNGFKTKIKIYLKYPFDTTRYKRIIILSEFDKDSNILSYSHKYFKPTGDSNHLVLKYKNIVQKININQIDSLMDYYQDLYAYYNLASKKNQITKFSPHYSLPVSIFSINKTPIIFNNTTKLILFDFWYMGCVPCSNAIPFLNYLNEKYFSQGLQLVAVNHLDTSFFNVSNFINRKNIKYSVILRKQNPYFDIYNIKIFPTMLLLDTNGKLLYYEEGYSIESNKTIEDRILKFLK